MVAKNLLQKHGIKFEKNTEGERLQTANKQELRVNGVLILAGTFQGKTVHMNCLVSDALHLEIIVSWHDAEKIGAVKITKDKPMQAITHCATISTPPLEEEFKKFIQELESMSVAPRLISR